MGDPSWWIPSAARQIEKDVPQPQPDVAIELLIRKDWPIRSSTKSIFRARIYSIDTESTTTLAPSRVTTMSSGGISFPTSKA